MLGTIFWHQRALLGEAIRCYDFAFSHDQNDPLVKFLTFAGQPGGSDVDHRLDGVQRSVGGRR